MKLRPPSSSNNREFINNMGGGMYWTLGGKDFFIFKILFGLLGFFVGIGSIGVKLYLRKYMGVRAVNPLMLIIHILLVWVIASDILTKEQSGNFIAGFARMAPFTCYYVAGVFFLALVHYINVWFLKEGKEKHSYHRGVGVLNYLWDDNGEREEYLRLIDPFLLAFGACFFLLFDEGKILTYILWIGCTCLLIEELRVFYLSWEAEMNLRDADKEAAYLSQKHEEYQKDQSNGKMDESPYRARTAKDK
jgi:hypothetical protein